MNKNEWSNKVNMVFPTNPRIGKVNREVLWLDRKEEEKLKNAFEYKDPLVILEGPSGVGKTSLVLTFLAMNKIKYSRVQIVHAMDWKHFCMQLLTKKENSEETTSNELEIGIDQALPVIKARFGHIVGTSQLSNEELIDRIASRLNEENIIDLLFDLNCIIFIDDLERANSELFTRIVDMCKSFVSTATKPKTHALIVGTNDIGQQLITKDDSLEDRVTAITLGGFKTSEGAWSFISKGLKTLKLDFPGNKVPLENQELNSLHRTIWEATDGLGKSMNELGREICKSSYGSTEVNIELIIHLANLKTEEHIRSIPKEYHTIGQFIKDNYYARNLVSFLYFNGIASGINYNILTNKLRGFFVKHNKTFNKNEFEEVIQKLFDSKFLYKSGNNGEIILPLKPNHAHALCVFLYRSYY